MPAARGKRPTTNATKRPWSERGRKWGRTFLKALTFTRVSAVVVGLLTLWVVPAFTRQWDDRQKAGELKAALATEIATATAAVVAPTLDERPPKAAARQQWFVSSLIIEAKVRTYFDPFLVNAWRIYAARVAAFISDAERVSAIRDDPPTKLSVKEVKFLKDMKVSMPFGDLSTFDVRLREGRAGEALSIITRNMAQNVISGQEYVTINLLEARPAGFSITRRDLWDDLTPW